jgi:hypothetical protein
MSLDERFLALGTNSLSKISIYNLANSNFNPSFYSTTRSFRDTLYISWKSDSKTLVLIDKTSFSVF